MRHPRVSKLNVLYNNLSHYIYLQEKVGAPSTSGGENAQRYASVQTV
jgi:hypothetical protein